MFKYIKISRYFIFTIVHLSCIYSNLSYCCQPKEGAYPEEEAYSESYSSNSSIVNTDNLPEQNPELLIKNYLAEYHCQQNLDVFFFNSGNGSFAITTFADNFSVFDCGGAKDNFESICWPIIAKIIENRKLSAVVLSHADSDHISLIETLINKINAQKINTSNATLFSSRETLDNLTSVIHNFENRIYTFDYDSLKWNHAYNEITDAYVNDALNACIFGDNNIGESAFLNPVMRIDGPGNDRSIVVKVGFCRKSFLFTGDATGKTLDAIRGNKRIVDYRVQHNRNHLKNVSILVIPHHGSDTNKSSNWLAQVINASKTEFHGAICSTSAKHKCNKHPRESIAKQYFPISAISKSTHEIFYYKDSDNSLFRRRTHKNLYVTVASKFGAYLFRVDNTGGLFILEDTMNFVNISNNNLSANFENILYPSIISCNPVLLYNVFSSYDTIVTIFQQQANKHSNLYNILDSFLETQDDEFWFVLEVYSLTILNFLTEGAKYLDYFLRLYGHVITAVDTLYDVVALGVLQNKISSRKAETEQFIKVNMLKYTGEFKDMFNNFDRLPNECLIHELLLLLHSLNVQQTADI